MWYTPGNRTPLIYCMRNEPMPDRHGLIDHDLAGWIAGKKGKAPPDACCRGNPELGYFTGEGAELSLATVSACFALLAADLSPAPRLGHASSPFNGSNNVPNVSAETNPSADPIFLVRFGAA